METLRYLILDVKSLRQTLQNVTFDMCSMAHIDNLISNVFTFCDSIKKKIFFGIQYLYFFFHYEYYLVGYQRVSSEYRADSPVFAIFICI